MWMSSISHQPIRPPPNQNTPNTHQAAGLRTKVLAFVLQNFDSVSKTHAFEEMARTNVDLVVEVLKKR
jgi:hypothetical protein